MRQVHSNCPLRNSAGKTLLRVIRGRSEMVSLSLTVFLGLAVLGGCATAAPQAPTPMPEPAAEPEPQTPTLVPEPAPEPAAEPPVAKPAPAPDRGQALDDELIEARILLKLVSAPGLELYDVGVKVVRGHVVLTGEVGDADARKRIEALAKQTRDVRRVTSKFTGG